MSVSSRWLAYPLLLGLSALTAGCGSDSAPLAGDAPADGERAYLSFVPDGPRPAGKAATVPNAGLTDSQVFWPSRSGALHVQDLAGDGVRDDLEVDFLVDRGDLSQTTRITMTAYGNTLSELLLAFEPAGLVFANPAELRVTIGAERVDRSLLDLQGLLLPFSGVEADHTHDGQTEAARVTSVRTFLRLPLLGDVETHDLLLYDYAVICVEVPGFSRYGLRR